MWLVGMKIIIIGLLLYNYYYFLLYARFHSSLVEHENLRSKAGFIGNSSKFFKINFLRCVIIKYRINIVSIFQKHDLWVKEKSMSNKWKNL